MAKTFVRGAAVENATSYELLEKKDGVYTHLTTQDSGGEIDIEVSALGLAKGVHTLVVRAHADGYESSKYSEPVEYNALAAGETDITNQFAWDSGWLYHATGAIEIPDNQWLVSNAVDVSDYSSLRFMQPQTKNANTPLGYAFFDSGMNYVSGATNGGTDYIPVEKNIEIPSNATYFRTMWMSTEYTNYNEANDISNFYCIGVA